MTAATAQPVLDLFEEVSESAVPCCHVCGAEGDRIVVDGVAVRDFKEATMWALLAITEHLAAAHAENEGAA